MMNAMNNTMNNAMNNNTNKEDKGMKKVNVFLTACKYTGYALGYSVTTAKLNTKELGRKIKASACGEAFVTGYAEAEDKATERFYEKCAKKKEKRQQKADEKAANEALDEMFESMMDTEEEQVEEPAPKNNVTVETKEAKTSLLGQDMMAWFMDKNHGWHLTFDDASIVGASQYCKDNQRAYVFQEGAVISQYIPTGYCVKHVLKDSNKIVALEYSSGMRIDLFDNGFIVTK